MNKKLVVGIIILLTSPSIYFFLIPKTVLLDIFNENQDNYTATPHPIKVYVDNNLILDTLLGTTYIAPHRLNLTLSAGYHDIKVVIPTDTLNVNIYTWHIRYLQFGRDEDGKIIHGSHLLQPYYN